MFLGGLPHERTHWSCIRGRGVAAAIAYAMLPMAQAGIVSKEKVVRAKTDLPASVATPNLPFEVLKPLY